MADKGFEIEGLVRKFGRTTAVDGVSLAAHRGQVLGLLGPNGAGKTTVIRVLATLLRPDAGRVRVAGIDALRDPAGVRRRIAFSGQHTSVDEELTGRSNLVMIGRLLDRGRQDARRRAGELLSRFGLDEAADRPVSTYSGGMRRRLDLAVGLVGRPEVVFLDEPSAGLDPGKRDELWRMVRELAQDGVTVLLTTQYLKEADALADEITVIDHGRLIASGVPADLKRQAGGHTVVLRPADAGDLDAAAAVVARVTGREPSRSHRHGLVAPVAGEAEFFHIAARLRELGIDVGEFAFRLPSLDEVFLRLTGATATGHVAEEAA
ncbi:ATP-binding cassette domain-containing protein [Streptomyces oryzae]|uniref:ATP-binding cassette domain-containing protein n=1 Tax=Streptomyces oryzae TaxID=1434886 RepID=A0ABS3XFL6_9ACTN|nr:ATP-binding cassette domain-containing protein [Streptomyces oryzae]MBO8194187.1 ATP-binding cassette domain-containing protein [Streptomyces oryzae]